MENEPQFGAEIKVHGEFVVGLTEMKSETEKGKPTKKQQEVENEFDLVLANLGEDIQQPDDGSPLIFYLTGTLGPTVQALFLDKDDADSCKMAIDEGWVADWHFPNATTFELRISTETMPILAKGGKLTVTLSGVKSKTQPGKATLLLGTDLDPKSMLKLEITKVKPLDGAILFFSSDPPEGTKILRDQKVTFRWHTIDLKERQLLRNGIPVDGAKFGGDEGSHTESISKDTFFTLVAGPYNRVIHVVVLPVGWHPEELMILPGDVTLPVAESPAYKVEMAALRNYKKEKGSLKLEPTEIINANNNCLYGVFRFKLLEKETTLIFETGETFGQWTPVKCAVPEGFNESPAIYFEDQICLVGGSQIDPDHTSNIVQRLDPKKGTSPKSEQASWSARMGHAVLVFNNEIWVMGGRDSAGNTLSDIWKTTTKDAGYMPGKTPLPWVEVKEAPGGKRWSPRCLFHPAVFKGQIWVYGGVKEPFSRDVYSDLWVYPSSNASNGWEKLNITSRLEKQGDPVASCLQVFRGKLHLFGKFRDRDDSSGLGKTLAFSLDESIDRGRWDDFPSDNLKGWGSPHSFSWQVLNFKDQYLMAKALILGKSVTDLQLYVGG